MGGIAMLEALKAKKAREEFEKKTAALQQEYAEYLAILAELGDDA